MKNVSPLIVGIGGTTSPNSSTECALKVALDAAKNQGARTMSFSGDFLFKLPHYSYSAQENSTEALQFVEAIRNAQGLIIASPGYHGSISGLVKNAIDYIEATSKDTRAYLDGMPVGLIANAYGWQATGTTLATLRSIVHSLRGWPTPFGAAVNTSGGVFKDGKCVDTDVLGQLQLVGKQVFEFAHFNQDKPALKNAS